MRTFAVWILHGGVSGCEVLVAKMTMPHVATTSESVVVAMAVGRLDWRRKRLDQWVVDWTNIFFFLEICLGWFCMGSKFHTVRRHEDIPPHDHMSRIDGTIGLIGVWGLWQLEN